MGGVVVSEETGQISVAENGTLTRNFTREKLHSLLTARLIPDTSEKKRLFRFKNRKEGQHEDDLS